MRGSYSSERVFEALTNRYRRQLLVALLNSNSQDDDDLDPLGVLAPEESVDDLDVAESELAHVHLPKLADAGFVNWDRTAGQIEKGPNWEEIAPLVRLMDDHCEELPDGWLT